MRDVRSRRRDRREDLGEQVNMIPGFSLEVRAGESACVICDRRREARSVSERGREALAEGGGRSG